jgi:hypothetical protein
MATATLLLLTIRALYKCVRAFAACDRTARAGNAGGAFLYGGCAWWLYFNSGLFG